MRHGLKAQLVFFLILRSLSLFIYQHNTLKSIESFFSSNPFPSSSVESTEKATLITFHPSSPDHDQGVFILFLSDLQNISFIVRSPLNLSILDHKITKTSNSFANLSYMNKTFTAGFLLRGAFRLFFAR